MKNLQIVDLAGISKHSDELIAETKNDFIDMVSYAVEKYGGM